MVFGKERPLITVETSTDCEDSSEGLFIKAPKIIHDQIVNMLGTNFLDYDILDLDVYYSNMMIASLSQFRAEAMGYPGYMENIEEWHAILDKIIFLLKQANEDVPLDEKNELAEWYEEYLKTKTLSLVEVKKGVRKYVDNDDEETKEKICQYYKREEELYEIRKQKRKEAFELLAEYLGHLWW